MRVESRHEYQCTVYIGCFISQKLYWEEATNANHSRSGCLKFRSSDFRNCPERFGSENSQICQIHWILIMLPMKKYPLVCPIFRPIKSSQVPWRFCRFWRFRVPHWFKDLTGPTPAFQSLLHVFLASLLHVFLASTWRTWSKLVVTKIPVG